MKILFLELTKDTKEKEKKKEIDIYVAGMLDFILFIKEIFTSA